MTKPRSPHRSASAITGAVPEQDTKLGFESSKTGVIASDTRMYDIRHHALLHRSSRWVQAPETGAA